MKDNVSISSMQLQLTGATASDTKLAEDVLAPFVIFTNFGSNLNCTGSEDDAEGFNNSCK